ncbi:Hypothetical protein R9X50_00382900 [Acrodontium crateriforme]|uniref:Cytokinin riboside 5'-monophosphate phosphoribohydrolase n=1 Tax=Acrodontium crateriforme TaxID=150365 RepID=A0AAQ3M4Z9_9PEZI|nr:Hypothetical protein R9X50_00382900 [Acrodontium crateriforme]
MTFLDPRAESVENNSTPVANGTGKKPVVCVFCGASSGNSPAHMEAARELAQVFHDRGLNLVYGGGNVGIMGEVARRLVALSGPEAVHGVIPEALIKFERGENGTEKKQVELDEKVYGRTTVVPDMHTRKQLMAREVIEGGPGGGFVALSGGYGTMEELMEVVTWNQLGIHGMGIVVYNVEGYYDGLLQWVKDAIKAGFVAEGNANIMIEAKTAENVVDHLRDYQLASSRFNLQWGQK